MERIASVCDAGTVGVEMLDDRCELCRRWLAGWLAADDLPHQNLESSAETR